MRARIGATRDIGFLERIWWLGGPGTTHPLCIHRDVALERLSINRIDWDVVIIGNCMDVLDS